MDFLAIDFETANQRPDSACQVAAVVVESSQIVDQRSWLIRPPSNYFAPMNISIHGIRPVDVVNAPTMLEVWSDLAAMMGGRTIIAHNARFDMGVLVASLAAFDVSCPDVEFQCTRALARAAWPGRRRYGLKPLGDWLGISFNHHDALEDARACAQVALAVEASIGNTLSLDEMERQLRVARGSYRNEQLTSPRRLRRSGLGSADSAFGSKTRPSSTSTVVGGVCVETIRQSCDGQPLAGKNIVMLGPLRGLSMEETVGLLEELGATIQQSIAGNTHFVVACGTSLSEAQQTVQDAVSTTEKSPAIRLLSERQFRALLPGGAISF